jgi:hypothetical protein
MCINISLVYQHAEIGRVPFNPEENKLSGYIKIIGWGEYEFTVKNRRCGSIHREYSGHGIAQSGC